MLKLKDRIEILLSLQDWILTMPNELEAAIHKAHYENKWFIPENSRYALSNIAHVFLQEENLKSFTEQYDIQSGHQKSIGLIFAGNIPLVGFHDFLVTFLSGHKAKIKLSDKDSALFKALWSFLSREFSQFETQVSIVERLKNFDAVIATGSDNSARQFSYYFKEYPSIIRRNRNSIAVLTGEEKQAELQALSHDMMRFFGLGCRNVSKIFIPKTYDIGPLMEQLKDWSWMMDHEKYKNNFDYNYAMLALNRIPFLSNDNVLFIEDNKIPSRIATLHYSKYSSLRDIEQEIALQKDAIQCVVSQEKIGDIETTAFGEAQKPKISDFADDVDTLAFLLNL